jgi:hypothetical protein
MSCPSQMKKKLGGIRSVHRAVEKCIHHFCWKISLELFRKQNIDGRITLKVDDVAQHFWYICFLGLLASVMDGS